MAEKKSKEREPYMASGEGDEEQADVSWKKKKGWSKFFKKVKKEVGGKK